MNSVARTGENGLALLQMPGLLSPEIAEWAVGAAEAGLSSAQVLQELVARGHLTQFQADSLTRGVGRSLLLGPYVVLDIIGTGSMGPVYQARSIEDGGLHAIKTVPRRSVINLQSVAEKVEALKQIRHPRVSAMVHIGIQGERVFMVWPYLEGESLEAVVQRQGPLPARQAAQIALQIASGLQAYHQQGLYHGLLKPADIRIGNDRRVRLLDFGVAFLLTCEAGASLLSTTTNSRALSRGLDCASPESILDPLDRTVAGDQYSLGCILYYCLTGQYPFPDLNPVKKMLGHQVEEPTPIRELAPDTPRRLEAIVSQLMQKKPADRYPSIDEVVRDLQRVMTGSFSGQGLRPSHSAAMHPSSPSSIPLDQTPPPTRRDQPLTLTSAARPPEDRVFSTGVWFTLVGVTAGSTTALVTWLLMRG